MKSSISTRTRGWFQTRMKSPPEVSRQTKEGSANILKTNTI